MSDLFRQEAIDHKRRRLHGKVRVSTPRAGTAMVGVLLAIVLVIGLVLLLGSYDRRERVLGWLVPEGGLVRLAPDRNGVVAKIHVEEGALVEAGDPLITIRHDVGFERDSASVDAQLGGLDDQKAALEAQLSLVREGQTLRRGELRSELASLDAERADLERQLEIQEQRYALARTSSEQDAGLFEKGVISQRDLASSEEAALSLQNAMLATRTRLVERRRERSRVASQLARLPVDEGADTEALKAQLSALAQRRGALEREGQGVIRAPVRGRVAALQTDVGASVPAGRALVNLLSLSGSGDLEAVLYAPPRAIGLVEEGQPVRLRFDAFPHQTFGTGTGQVASVSASVIDAAELPIDLGLRGPVYQVRVPLDAQQLSTPSTDHALQAGMTLQAHIVLERRRLWRVLLSPLLEAW
ncbi:MAG: HlyD family efflux transporter periplasmic adaptor subunit [Myxococcota bacterium]